MFDQAVVDNLPWHEQALEVKKYHDSQQEKYGQSGMGRIKDGWSVRDTANSLRRSVGWVCETLKLAKAIETRPSIKRFSNRSTALNSLNPTKAYLEDGTPIFVRSSVGKLIEGKVAGHGFVDREHFYIIRLDAPIFQGDSSFYYISVRNDRVEERSNED